MSTFLKPDRSQKLPFFALILGVVAGILQGCAGANLNGSGSNPQPLEITSPSSLGTADLGTSYSTTLAATGGTSPYTWSVSAGTLPGGFGLSSAGVLSGTPTAAGTFSFTAKITDSASRTATALLQITIATGLQITTTNPLTSGEVSVDYSTTFSATGGTTPYTWSVSAGALPGGLTLSSAGLLSGTPTAAGTFDFTAKVIDATAGSKTAPFQVVIAPAVLLITTTSPITSGQLNVVYSTTLAATGGTTPYSWSVSAGALPGGLTLSSAGLLSGTPTAAGTFNFTAKVIDAAARTKTAPLQFLIAPASLMITTASPLTSGQVNVAYSTALAATGGTTPYTWTVSAGAPPGGLTFSNAGVLSGTPTGGGTFNFTAKVTDAAARTATAPLQIVIAPAPLMIITSSLPNGQVSTAYSATLVATGGNVPYTWTLTSGTLPMGLLLNASTGTVSGTPTQAVASTPLTFQVTDSTSPTALTQNANLTLTVSRSVSNISVTLTPKRGGVAIAQQLPFTATVANDVGSAGVSWKVTIGGTLNNQTTTSASFSAAAAGVFTITATSAADNSKSASATVGVTDLTGVFTYHNNLSRDGSNPSEYALTTSTVAQTTFGKLFSCTTDGSIYTQPLWVANLTIAGVKRNVVFVATQHDSLFAFDADASPCVKLWQVSLIDQNHGGAAGETTVPSGPTGFLVGSGNGDITPEVGVTGTPVIDPGTNTLYVVSKSVDSLGQNFFQRLHAINALTGSELGGSPVTIAGTYPGTGDGGSTTTFNPGSQHQRPALALVNGIVYISWASHEDNDSPAYYGWVMGYNASTLAQTAVLNVTPNAQFGGIWMGGGAPAADSSNNLYFLTGNGNFDANSSTAPNNDYGDSFLKVTSNLVVSQYFTPSDQANDNANDNDFGSGGAAILVDQPSSPVQHLVIGGGKDGTLYLLNRDSMGGLGDSSSVQNFNIGNSIFATGAFWYGNIYIAGANGPLQSYSFNTTTGMFGLSNVPQSPGTFGFPGSTPSVSSLGTLNGIVWALDNGNYCTPSSPGCGPAVLHAYDATNLATELWNSLQGTGNAAGNAVKFTVPTVANGKVYVGTRGNNTGGNMASSTIPGELDVYGLLPN
jgi:hypothetical protein